MTATTALVLSCDFDAIQGRRDACVRAAQDFDAAIAKAPDGFPRINVYDAVRHVDCRWSLDVVIREIERDAWSSLVADSGLYSFMDAKARADWAHQLDKGKLLPFTRENAEAFIADLHSKRGDMVKRGVGECFRRLSGHYKTNKPDRFGRRMIVTHVLTVSGSGSGQWWTTHHRACDDFDDLMRVLRLLRGLPEPDHRRGAHMVMHDAGADGFSKPWPRVVEFDYFDVKVYKNGNGHLTFKHEADVMRLNKILSMESGGMALAPTERAARPAPPPTPDPTGELAFFATPPELAARLVAMADVQPGHACLEPSAGDGAIAVEIAAKNGGSPLTCVEIDGDRAAACLHATLGTCDMQTADFLTWDPMGQRFDRIVMNPPFTLPGHQMADVDHVMRALELLAPGGRLVAVMSAAVKFRTLEKAVQFRKLLEERGGTIEDLPADSFAASGTRVSAVVVTIDA